MATTYKQGTTKRSEVKNKVIKGWKRFSTFANATALAILVGFAAQNDYKDLTHGDRDVQTFLLTISIVLVGITAAWLYVKFFTDEA